MIVEYHSPNTHFFLRAQEGTSPIPLMLSLDIRLTSMVNDINWCDRKRSFKCICTVPPALEYLSQGAAGPKWLKDTCCMSQPNQQLGDKPKLAESSISRNRYNK